MLAVHQFRGDEAVDFKVLGDKDIPQDIVGQVIPEYRDLERALACVVGDKVYVLVSRGEKPTSGFDVRIEKMVIEEQDGVSNLAVYANFSDPEPGTALTQILTYPLQVAETSLKELPDQIELRVQYKQ
nr:protease complex subunit PrcB family protein [Clostridium aminobutyricum]